MSFTWNGKKVAAEVQRAAEKGINKTMAEAVITAKLNHPGWSNRTSKAEGSIQIIEPAKPIGNEVGGKWGSKGVNYMIFLELKHGGALREAAGVTYPNLARNIAAAAASQ